MFGSRKASNQRTKFLESLSDGLKEQEEGKGEVDIDQWKEDSKIITEREEYVEKMRATVDEWNQDIDLLDDKARNSGNEKMEKASALIGQLDQNLAEGNEALMNIAGTTDDSWVDLKPAAEAIWENITKLIGETRKVLE
jgi:hypothetical protein